MLVYLLVLFALAAIFGVYMMLRVFKGAMPPWQAAVIHGLFAATGLVLLLYSVLLHAVFRSGAPQAQAVMIAAALLVIAALGGLVLVGYHFRRKLAPKALALVHAVLAAAGFVTLAVAALEVG